MDASANQYLKNNIIQKVRCVLYTWHKCKLLLEPSSLEIMHLDSGHAKFDEFSPTANLVCSCN